MHFLESEPDPDLGFSIIAGFEADSVFSLNQGKVPIRDGHGSVVRLHFLDSERIRILKFVDKQDSGADSESKS